MTRYEAPVPERKLIMGFAAAGIVLFAGTLVIGFSERDIHRVSPPAVMGVTASVDTAG
jgi:hypothetical protein